MTRKKGVHILFGAPGSGKSTEAACAYQKALYVKSSPNVLQFYENNLSLWPGKVMPKTHLIDTFMIGDKIILDPKTQMPARQQQWPALIAATLQIMQRSFAAFAAKQPPPYEYLVFDEMGTFMQRVFEEISPTIMNEKGDKIDTRKAFGVLAAMFRDWTDHLRQLPNVGVGVGLVFHDQDPEPDKKGGPKCPSQNIMKQMCADVDGVFLRTVRDLDLGLARERIWRVHASQNSLCKIRGIPDSDAAAIEKMNLEQILEKSGY